MDPAQSDKCLAHIVVTHDNIEFSKPGPTLSRAKKIKASMTIIPVIAPWDNIINLGDKTSSTPATLLPPLEINTFTPGSSGSFEGSTSKRKNYKKKTWWGLGRLLSWNCRGVLRAPATQALHAWVRRCKSECIFLMETKTNKEGRKMIERALGYQFSCMIPAVGMEGGFVLIWNNDINLKVAEATDGIFEVVINDPLTSFKWRLFAVYGRPYDREKISFWDSLALRINKCSMPWMIVGDLNLIAHSWEKREGKRVSPCDMSTLLNFMHHTGGLIWDSTGAISLGKTILFLVA
uniref:Endonuclease/exonuclease/phosphatase domain-containing protein n=1 Tax=Cannabis sativa TaxID=3483 RepID=A0A803PDR3_CANSA